MKYLVKVEIEQKLVYIKLEKIEWNENIFLFMRKAWKISWVFISFFIAILPHRQFEVVWLI